MVEFEHQGYQHYEATLPFHEKKGDFEKLQENDRVKAELCEANGVALVVVPFNVPRRKLMTFLKERLDELGVEHDADLELTMEEITRPRILERGAVSITKS